MCRALASVSFGTQCARLLFGVRCVNWSRSSDFGLFIEEGAADRFECSAQNLN
jgi:hypothetical protein